MNIIICGIGGKVGKALLDTINKSENYTVVAGIDCFADSTQFEVPIYKSFALCNATADVVIDFSRAEAIYDILPYCKAHRTPLVISTTGHSEEQMELIKEYSGFFPIFKSSNMTLGVNLLISLAKQAARFLGNTYDIEIIEYHHNLKVDSPSGTALSIAQSINEEFDNDKEFVYGRHSKNDKRTSKEIGIHAVRGGTIVGKHDVMYIGTSEIVTLSHQAESRQVFAFGALRAAEFLQNKGNGLYNMNDIIGADYSVTTVTGTRGAVLLTIPSLTHAGFSALLDGITKEKINLDMISQAMLEGGSFAISFTLGTGDLEAVQALLQRLDISYNAKKNCAILLIEGAGMEHQYGVADRVMKLVAEAGAEVLAITTSKTDITCCIDEASLTAAEKALKDYYDIKKD